MAAAFADEVGDTPPKPLKRYLEYSSAWTRSDAETIGVFYNDSGLMERDEWRAILRRKIEDTGYQSPHFYDEQWKRRVKRFCNLMEDVHYCHELPKADKLLQVLARPRPPSPRPRPSHEQHRSSDSESDSYSSRPTGSSDGRPIDGVPADSEQGAPSKKFKSSSEPDDSMSHSHSQSQTQTRASRKNISENEDEVCLITDQLLQLTAAEERLLYYQTKYIQEGRTDAIEFISYTVEFLKTFEAILSFWLDGVIPPEAAFQHLFQTYAAIFRIPFRPGSILGKRSTPVFGTAVKCVPDLLYTECFLDKETRTQCNYVVTVAEVKLACEDKQSPPNMSPKGMTLRSAENSSGFNRMSSPTTSSMADIPLPDGVKGQHAIQLLTEVSLALPDRYDPKKKSMLGLIVQATKVRLTYFEISKDHLNLIQQGTVPTNLGGNTATVRYSQAYDIFIKEDREDLVHMMVGLAAIGHNYRKTPFYRYLM
ncbi:uncharacterized protein LOC135503357 [Lineus longissimus]|uniref:uncharacterized protein LOC135503357 n=1 Tax=Lineus longissimus TaxID=88925 RepID=UPI00315CB7F0